MGRYALPVGFAECKYPKDSSYLTTRKNMTDHRNPNYDCQITFMPFKYSGGSRATAMQILQLHLTGAARSWLRKLPDNSIGSWSELSMQLTSNFRSTYTRIASIEEVKSCVQRSDEALRSYIQCWSVIKNSAENVSDEREIDAFVLGLRRSDLAEEMGRTKPRTISKLMEIANRFVDREYAYHNKRA
jgi:hypothetical protein